LVADLIKSIEAAPPAESAIFCSPDSGALLYLAIVDGRTRFTVIDIRTGTSQDVPLPADAVLLGWVHDQAPAVEASVQIVNPPRRLLIGERVPLTAHVRLTNGQMSAHRTFWSSLDPSIASVGSNGDVVGIRPGTGRIVVTSWAWHADTTVVEVGGVPQENLELRDEFLSLDTALWQPVGNRKPELLIETGLPALYLTGDGQYEDGLVLRRPITLPQGATLEATFRLPLTRVDRQQFALCLSDADVLPGRLGRDPWDWETRAEVCFTYPAGFLQDFDSTVAAIRMSRVTRHLRMPRALADGWRHVSVQIGPDGQVRIFVDRRHVLDMDVILHDVPARAWRVRILGSSVDTRLLVRDVSLWHGQRQ
jgi:hypothetical protein